MALLDRYDCFLFDLDGVLYRGTEPIEGAPEALRALRDAGKRVAFVTNNSARTPQAVADHLRSVGVEADAGEVETSAMATADLLGSRGWCRRSSSGRKVSDPRSRGRGST